MGRSASNRQVSARCPWFLSSSRRWCCLCCLGCRVSVGLTLMTCTKLDLPAFPRPSTAISISWLQNSLDAHQTAERTGAEAAAAVGTVRVRDRREEQ